uniref:Selenoprotein W n=1 Tax=Ciona savignyi TaxID=51511 RepID=H2Z2T9_CIOSA
MAAKVKLHVLYCGGCGYGSRFRRLENEIQSEYDRSYVEISGESTPTINGYFEVYLNEEIVHSKKNGDGFVDTD